MMNEIDIPKRTIKRILQSKTHPLPMMDERNKLEILAVRTGLKTAFLASTHITEVGMDYVLPLLKQLAMIFELKFKFTINPPLYFSRRPDVKSSFIDAYYTQTDFEALWIYHDPELELNIDKCISGKLNEGNILGYPECCTKWHEEARVLEVESSFQDIEKYMATHPLELAGFQVKTEIEMYKAIIGMVPHTLENKEKWERMTDEHLFGTWMKYPFVPHWACSACLSGKNKETEELNHKYKELASSLGQNFEKNFIGKVKQVLQAIDHPIV